MNLIDWSPVVSLHHEDAFETNLVVSIFLSQTAWSEVL